MQTNLREITSGLCRPSYRLATAAVAIFVLLATGHAQAASSAPVAGVGCSPLGTTGMTSGGTDILACLVNPAGGTPAYIWQRAGSSSINLNSIPTCPAGEALNFNGRNFYCVTASVALPTCGANQALSSNGTSFTCVDLPSNTGSGGGTTVGAPPLTYTSCVDSYCSGTSSAVLPVVNTTLCSQNASSGACGAAMPAVCNRNWWINTSGSNFTSNCDTGWTWAANCQGFGSGCPYTPQ